MGFFYVWRLCIYKVLVIQDDFFKKKIGDALATSITYHQAKSMLDTAMDSLQRAMRKRVTSAHGRMLQAQEIEQLQTLVDKWDRKVTELDPAIDSSIQVGQMVPR